jgi:hypothetical protein
MIDAWMHVELSDRERAQPRRCPDPACDHPLLPVQDHCPECGVRWTPPPEGPESAEARWERPAFLMSMSIIGAVTVLPILVPVMFFAGRLIQAAVGD